MRPHADRARIGGAAPTLVALILGVPLASVALAQADVAPVSALTVPSVDAIAPPPAPASTLAAGLTAAPSAWASATLASGTPSISATDRKSVV